MIPDPPTKKGPPDHSDDPLGHSLPNTPLHALTRKSPLEWAIAAQSSRLAHLRKPAVPSWSVAKLFKAKFSFDEGPSWEGWTDGTTWNGWGRPLFDRKTSEQIVKWMKANHWLEDWEWQRKAPMTKIQSPTEQLMTQSSEGRDYWPEQALVTPEGKARLFPLGAGAWTWNTDVDEDDDEDEDDGEEFVEMVDALAAVNAHRRKIGMRPLDPDAAGWTTQDILDEHARIRTLNPLKERLL